jgi:hypothetical protein
MTKKKLLKLIVLDLLILLLVLVVGFYFFGQSLIARAVEKAASSALGVPVTVKSISLSLLKGQVGINGLVVKNPPGYANDTLLELGEGVVSLDIKSLMSDTIKIQLIKLDNTKMTMEQKGLTSNLKEILDKLPKEEKPQVKPETKPEAKPAAKGNGKNLLVQKLEITGTNVQVKLLPLPGKSDTVSMKLDPIVMENLGTDSKLSMSKLVAKVMGALAVGVTKQGVGLLPKDMVSGLDSALGSMGDLGKSGIKEGQKALETTTQAGKGVVEGVGGLLGGKKDPNKK